MHGFIRSALVASVLIAAPQAAAAQTSSEASPFSGTWKLDTAASKFSGPAAREEVRVYEVKGNKVTVTSTGTDSEGKKTKFGYSAEYDGKFYPMTGNPVGDRIALKRVDDRTVEATLMKGEAVSGYGKVWVSPDGKRLVLTRRTLRENAEPLVDELSFVRDR